MVRAPTTVAVKALLGTSTLFTEISGSIDSYGVSLVRERLTVTVVRRPS